MNSLHRVLSAILLATLLHGCDNTLKDHFSRVQGQGSRLAAATDLQGSSDPGGASIHLTWKDNATGETGYRVEANDAPFDGGIPLLLHSLPADSISFDLPVQPGKTYYIRVLATSGAQSSPPSEVITVSTPNVPPAPYDLVATVVSSTRIDLSWTNPPGAIIGNRVERSLDGGATWSTRFSFSSPTLTVSDTGLSADTEYGYRVFASNSTGESAPSVAVIATTLTNAMTFASTAGANNVGRQTSIAVSAAGLGHVSHYDVTNGNVLYTATSGNPLPVSTVDGGPTGTEDVGGNGTSIALDAAGKIHIVAQDVTHGKLRYVTNASGSFVASTIDGLGVNGQAPKIAISPADGSIHVLYFDDLPGPDNLRHASRTPPGTIWSVESVLSSPTYLVSWSMAIDPAGALQISFSHTDDGVTYELVHGKKSGGPWAFTPVTSAGMPGENSIAVDGSGKAHIAFQEQSTVRLMHATNSGGPWSTEVLHSVPGTNLGLYNSIAINPATGRLHVAYYDATNQDLLYARKDLGGLWVLKLIDTAGDVGSYSGIGLDGSGQVKISYHDATNGQLKVATGSP